MAIGGRTRINQSELARLGTGPKVLAMLRRRGEMIVEEQKRRCPVSPYGSDDHPPGHLRDSIHYTIGRDSGGYYLVCGTDVDYALMVEFPTRPHIIQAHGNYSLHNKKTGQYFGPIVHHPGTEAQPFLAPGLRAGMARTL